MRKKYKDDNDEKISLKKGLLDLEYYHKNKNNEMARETLALLEHYYPNDTYVKFEVAKNHQMQGEYDEAESGFKELIDCNCINTLAAKYELARIYNKLGRFVEGRKLCQNLLSENYRKGNTLIILGDIEIRSGNYSLAKVCYEEASKNCDLGYSRLADLELNNGNINNAKALQLNVDNKRGISTRTCRNQIRIAINTSHYQEARELVKTLEERLDGGFTESGVYFLVKTYIKLGSADRAHDIFNKYKDRLDGSEYKNMSAAELAFYDGNDKEEMDNLYEIIKKDGRFASTANHIMGLVFKRNNVPEKAEEYFKNGLNSGSYLDVNNYLELVYLYVHQGRFDEAREYLDYALNTHNSSVKKRAEKIEIYLDRLEDKFISPDRLQGYMNNQLFNYSKESALEHIKGHTKEDTSGREKTVFNDKVDIKKLYDQVYEEIKSMKPLDYDVCDTYILKKEDIGRIGIEQANYMAVSTITGTKDIITMFPVETYKYNTKDVFYDDQSIEDDNTLEKEKPKTYSAIDKFNKRYGLK